MAGGFFDEDLVFLRVAEGDSKGLQGWRFFVAAQTCQYGTLSEGDLRLSCRGFCFLGVCCISMLVN